MSARGKSTLFPFDVVRVNVSPSLETPKFPTTFPAMLELVVISAASEALVAVNEPEITVPVNDLISEALVPSEPEMSEAICAD